MSDLVYQAGNSIQISAKFRALNPDGSRGPVVDPTTVEVRIYDDHYKLIETHTGAEIMKLDTGYYAFWYTSPITPQVIWYEFYCEINGVPALKRDMLRTEFQGYY
jgi:hypothetical protein